MDRPRFYRGLRITASAVCLIVCGLLIALWVRSQWQPMVYVINTDTRVICVLSLRHELLTETFNVNFPSRQKREIAKKLIEREAATLRKFGGSLKTSGTNAWGFRWNKWNSVIPHWFPVILTVSLAAVPWIRWSFGLRTMLIATTLIAVVLA